MLLSNCIPPLVRYELTAQDLADIGIRDPQSVSMAIKETSSVGTHEATTCGTSNTDPLVVRLHSVAGHGGTWSSFRGELVPIDTEQTDNLPGMAHSRDVVVRVAYPDMMVQPSSIRREIMNDQVVGAIAIASGIAPKRFGLFRGKAGQVSEGVSGDESESESTTGEVWVSVEEDGGEVVVIDRLTGVQK